MDNKWINELIRRWKNEHMDIDMWLLSIDKYMYSYLANADKYKYMDG